MSDQFGKNVEWTSSPAREGPPRSIYAEKLALSSRSKSLGLIEPVTPPPRPNQSMGDNANGGSRRGIYDEKLAMDARSRRARERSKQRALGVVEQDIMAETAQEKQRHVPTVVWEGRAAESSPMDERRQHVRMTSEPVPVVAYLVEEDTEDHNNSIRSDTVVAAKVHVPRNIVICTKTTQEQEKETLSFRKSGDKPKGSIREIIFGDGQRSVPGDIPACLQRRDLLKFYIKPNAAVADQWIVSIQTDQDAYERNDTVEMKRSMRKFCANSKHHAREIGLALSPPLRSGGETNSICHVCKAKFALLKRPIYCRNCGVCVCSSCSASWPGKMIPETYNIERESQVKVCVACDWVATAFRVALLKGKFKDAVNLYTTGNVNLRSPFANVGSKEEILYPIHAAVKGGNFSLLKWLTTNHCCPLRDAGTAKSSGGPILTSKGRSALGIALEIQNMEMICYFVGKMDMSFDEEKNLSVSELIRFSTRLIGMVPDEVVAEKAAGKAKDDGMKLLDC